MIRTWLPVVLRTRPTDAIETVTACATRSCPDTVAVTIDEIEREMATGEGHMFFANIIPTNLWPGALARRIVAFIEDEALPAPTRAALLKLLAERDPEAAMPVALRASGSEAQGNNGDALRSAALNIRLALDPEEAWPLIEDAYRRRGTDALREWSFLWQRPRGVGRPLAEWPTARLERLGEILIESFPLPTEEEPQLRSGWVTTDDELQSVRDRIVGILIQRRVKGDTQAGATLCTRWPRFQTLMKWHLRQHQAEQLLVGLTERINSQDTQPGITVEDAVRLLDDSEFRLIRSHDDLLTAVLHALEQIDSDVAFDLSLLYGKNETDAQEPNSYDIHKGRKRSRRVRRRLNEDALQAYVRRRLMDLLPGRIPGLGIELIRESQGKYQRRFDLDIFAPDLARQFARVRVEIKWSDNKETETSLTEQLLTPAWLTRLTTQPDWHARMSNERREQLGLPVNPVELLDQDRPQFGGVLGCEVRQPAVLGVLPHRFVRIRLGGVARQLLRNDFRVTRQVGAHHLRAVVNLATVPQDRHRTGDVPAQLPQEGHRVLAVGVGVVGQEVEVQPQSSPLWADRHGADGRDPVVPVPALEDRRAPSRGERAADRRCEHEARLVEEHQVGRAATSFADDLGQLLTPSVVDGHLVAFLGPSLRLLAGPAQASLKDLAHVLGVEADLEVPLDQLSDPCGGPQFSPPAMGLGPLQEQPFEFRQWLGGQSRLGTEMRLGGESLQTLSRELDPGVDGGSATAEKVGDIVGRFTLFDQFDGTESAALKFLGGPDGSHTNTTSETVELFDCLGWSQ